MGINVNKNENIEFNIQLIKSDNISVEENATVSYRVFDSSATVELVSSQTAAYNAVTQSYTDTLVPSASWTNQDVGNYLIVWSVADTIDDFNSVYTENLNINIDNTDIQKILGLVHSNMDISQTVFDGDGNLTSARLKIYENSADVGSNSGIIATYRITASPSGPGRFVNWKQVEII